MHYFWLSKPINERINDLYNMRISHSVMGFPGLAIHLYDYYHPPVRFWRPKDFSIRVLTLQVLVDMCTLYCWSQRILKESQGWILPGPFLSSIRSSLVCENLHQGIFLYSTPSLFCLACVLFLQRWILIYRGSCSFNRLHYLASELIIPSEGERSRCGTGLWKSGSTGAQLGGIPHYTNVLSHSLRTSPWCLLYNWRWVDRKIYPSVLCSHFLTRSKFSPLGHTPHRDFVCP